MKLIIADDEKMARETIARLIDWESLGVKVVGLCGDGISAYHAILDEMPELVLTDIKMPGMSGLEIIEKVTRTDSLTQFIILSGYGEFEYAKKAMYYGVKNFLLKPCSETQLRDAIREAMEEWHRKKHFLQMSELGSQSDLQPQIMKTILIEGIISPSFAPGQYQKYQKYFDFTKSGYELCSFFYLEEKHLKICLGLLEQLWRERLQGLCYYGIYVKNVLLIYFETDRFGGDRRVFEEFDTFCENLPLRDVCVTPEYRRETYACLSDLLDDLIKRTRRYEAFYYLSSFEVSQFYNHGLLTRIPDMVKQLSELDAALVDEKLWELRNLIAEYDNPELVKQSLFNILVQCAADDRLAFSPGALSETLMALRKETVLEQMISQVFCKLSELFAKRSEKKEYSFIVESIRRYVSDNIGNPYLNLKYIAENFLYMNVDYVSRCFVKETGVRFSQYLVSTRIDRAKELLEEEPVPKIAWIAEQVGCGNNPQYFSQIFKKNTGLSPTEYLHKRK